MHDAPCQRHGFAGHSRAGNGEAQYPSGGAQYPPCLLTQATFGGQLAAVPSLFDASAIARLAEPLKASTHVHPKVPMGWNRVLPSSE